MNLLINRSDLYSVTSRKQVHNLQTLVIHQRGERDPSGTMSMTTIKMGKISKPQKAKKSKRFELCENESESNLPDELLHYVQKYSNTHFQDKEVKEKIMVDLPVPKNI